MPGPRLAPPTLPGPRPAAEGRGAPGGAALASGRGIRRGVTGKLVRVPGVSPVFPGARPAGAPAPRLPPSFTAHQIPPSVPRRHGAAASAQEVTNVGNREKEGGGGRGRGRLGQAGPRPPSRLRGPDQARRESEAGLSAGPRLSTRRRGPRGGRASPLPRPRGLAAWKVAGQRRAPRGRTPGPGGLFPPGKFTKPRDVKLGN